MLQARGDGPATVLRVAGFWVVSRVVLALVVVGAAWAQHVPGPERATGRGARLLERFTWWDSWHYLRIAEVGYLPPGLPCCDQAFFPGYPAILAALGPLVGGNLVVAGLVVSLVAGAAAAVLLHQVAERQAAGSGRWAVLFLAVAPYGIFFSAVYTESLFLALTLGAWLLAQRGRWWWAGALAAGACAVRVNGLFLVVALAVTYLLQLRTQGRRRPRPDVVALALGPAVVALYAGYLAARTGDLNAWQQAQSTGWVRENAWPWQGLAAGWHAAVSAPAPDLVVSRWADLLSVLAGTGLVAVLVRWRRWDQAVLVGLNVAVLVCSTMLTSSARYALLWFPGYLVLAELAQRGRWAWLRWAVPLVCAPVLVALSIAFAEHYWVA